MVTKQFEEIKDLMGIISDRASAKICAMAFVCACLVVAIHNGWKAEIGTGAWWINNLIQQGLARIAVPFFFVVSGYFLAAHFQEDEWWKRGVLKRVKTIVLPYFVWALLGVYITVPLGVIADYVAGRPFGHCLLVKCNWVQVFGWDLTSCPDSVQLWYLRCLMLLVVLSPLIKFFLEHFGVALLCLLYVLWCIHSVMRLPSFEGQWSQGQLRLISFFACSLSLSGLLFFCIGIFIRMRDIRLNNSCARVLGPVCLISGVVILGAYTFAVSTGFEWAATLQVICIPLLLYGTWVLVPEMRQCGRGIAFAVFVGHISMMRFIGVFLMRLDLSPGERALSNWVFSIGASLILYCIVHKSKHLTYIMYGGR